MAEFVIVGAGGHGREVADILTETGAKLLGFIDDNPAKHGTAVDGYPVVGGFDWFDAHPQVEAVVAVGVPKIARQLADRLAQRKVQAASCISPRAVLSPHCQLGRGVTIFPGCYLHTGVRLGDFAVMNLGATASHDCQIGDYAFLGPRATLAGNVTLGEGCFVGTGANFIPGVTVGDWTVVGAGATVCRDLPGGITAVGVPAKPR